MLRRAQDLGFLGPGAVDTHIRHAHGFGEALVGVSSPLLDLGSGAGVPGLVLARIWSESRWVLLDAGKRRVSFLASAVSELGLSGRVEVIRGRAEELARQPALRGKHAAVVARAFATPAVTAECGAGFLAVGGRLIVSEPPDASTDRWPPGSLSALGLRMQRRFTSVSGHHFVALDQVERCPDRYPRRTGIPAKRPLF